MTLLDAQPAGVPDWLPWILAVIGAMFVKPMWDLLNRLIFQRKNGRNGLPKGCPEAVTKALGDIQNDHKSTAEAVTKALAALVDQSKGSHEKLIEGMRDISDLTRQSIRWADVIVRKQEKALDEIQDVRSEQRLIKDRLPRGVSDK